MEVKADYNSLIPEKYRLKLNSQHNKMVLEGNVDETGRILQPYRFVVGLGEKHFKSFEHEIKMISDRFPWAKKKHVRFILNELILNSQFSMLREVIKKVPAGKKVPGYFYLTIYVNNDFFAAGIEEFGDFFDYYGYLEEQFSFDEFEDEMANYYDKTVDDHETSLFDLSKDKLKLILTTDNRLIVPDGSNKLGLQIIENATDHDFYISSFYKVDRYMWKRINLRFENDLSG